MQEDQAGTADPDDVFAVDLDDSDPLEPSSAIASVLHARHDLPEHGLPGPVANGFSVPALLARRSGRFAQFRSGSSLKTPHQIGRMWQVRVERHFGTGRRCAIDTAEEGRFRRVGPARQAIGFLFTQKTSIGLCSSESFLSFLKPPSLHSKSGHNLHCLHTP